MPCQMLAHCRRPRAATHIVHLLAFAVLVCLRCQQAGASAALPATRTHTWSYFNIQSFVFVGNWNNQTYQAQVSLRNICHNSTFNLVRMMVFVHDAPYVMTSPEGVHSVTPATFLDNGTLPGVWFQSSSGTESITANVLTSYDQLIKVQEDATALVLAAELPAGEAFTLRMEGSERVHQLPVRCTLKQHPLFSDRSVWLGTVDASAASKATAEHTGLAFQSPPLNARKPRNQTEDKQSISNELVDELAELLRLAGPNNADTAAVDGNTDGTYLGSVSTSSGSSADTMSSADGTRAGRSQQFQQRKLFSRATNIFHTVLTSVHTKVAPVGYDGGSSSNSGSSSTQHFQQQGVNPLHVDSSRSSGSTMDTTATAQVLTDAGDTAVRLSSFVAAAAAEEDAHVPQQVPVPDNSSSITRNGGEGSSLRTAAVDIQASSRPGDSVRTDQPSSGGAAAAMDFRRRGAVLRFLALQHLAHHRALGFTGSIMVVTPHTAEQLMQSRPLRRAMQRQRLVLIVWDRGLEPRASHFMQVPAYNLLRLAAWGSNTALGFWDLDEYLVLPGHEPVTHEVFSGCMSPTLAVEPEAMLPSMWASSSSWNTSAEVSGWMQYGYWSKAVSSMQYEMWPYTFCDGACKSIIHPNSDLLYQVHQHARPPPRQAVEPVNWRCGYILHFYKLWSLRTPELMTVMGYEDAGMTGIAVFLDDVLPKATIERLARSAKLYAELIGSNPALAQ